VPNLILRPKTKLSSMRKLAIGTWRTTYDPSVYGSMSLRMDKTLAYLEDFRSKKNRKLTLSHILAKVMGMVLHEMPDANAILRFNRIYLRQDIGVFFQVAMQDPQTGELDLSGMVIRDTHTKSLVEIYDEFSERVEKVRSYKDENLEETRSLIKSLPHFLLHPFVDMLGFLSYTLNWDLSKLGIPKDALGSVMITNVGSLGLEEAYVPLVPYSRVPLLLALGRVRDEAVVIDKKIEILPMMRIFATFDHRILDGAHAAKMSKLVTEYIENPYKYFDEI
jgi:pyruvate/2-oxoglutarate dehydrogenase complex dihydrolipoamide acyltransferase (E2) component